MRSCVLRLYFLNSRIWNSGLEFQNLYIFLGVRGFFIEIVRRGRTMTKVVGNFRIPKRCSMTPRKLVAKRIGLARKLEFLVNLSRNSSLGNFRLGILD